MGVLTDIIVADPSEASEIEANYPDQGIWNSVDLKGHNEISMSDLWSVLDLNADSREELFTLLTDSERGPWVFLFPRQLTILLAGIDETRWPDIIEQWCQKEEMIAMGLDEVDREDLLEQCVELGGLAGEALALDKELLMWVCL